MFSNALASFFHVEEWNSHEFHGDKRSHTKLSMVADGGPAHVFFPDVRDETREDLGQRSNQRLAVLCATGVPQHRAPGEQADKHERKHGSEQ
jgi:hypothetical protein